MTLAHVVVYMFTAFCGLVGQTGWLNSERRYWDEYAPISEVTAGNMPETSGKPPYKSFFFFLKERWLHNKTETELYFTYCSLLGM